MRCRGRNWQRRLWVKTCGWGGCRKNATNAPVRRAPAIPSPRPQHRTPSPRTRSGAQLNLPPPRPRKAGPRHKAGMTIVEEQHLPRHCAEPQATWQSINRPRPHHDRRDEWHRQSMDCFTPLAMTSWVGGRENTPAGHPVSTLVIARSRRRRGNPSTALAPTHNRRDGQHRPPHGLLRGIRNDEERAPPLTLQIVLDPPHAVG